MDQSVEKNRKRQVGTVISSKMDKTVTVKVVHRMVHPQYQKVVEREMKCYAHDESNAVEEGQKVLIEETRPLSKLKRWRVVEVL